MAAVTGWVRREQLVWLVPAIGHSGMVGLTIYWRRTSIKPRGVPTDECGGGGEGRDEGKEARVEAGRQAGEGEREDDAPVGAPVIASRGGFHAFGIIRLRDTIHTCLLRRQLRRTAAWMAVRRAGSACARLAAHEASRRQVTPVHLYGVHLVLVVCQIVRDRVRVDLEPF